MTPEQAWFWYRVLAGVQTVTALALVVVPITVAVLSAATAEGREEGA